ncbi:TULIP family P47-like protein [Streptomyces sp. NPDC002537]
MALITSRGDAKSDLAVDSMVTARLLRVVVLGHDLVAEKRRTATISRRHDLADNANSTGVNPSREWEIEMVEQTSPVNMNGWDTVFAIPFDIANKSLMTSLANKESVVPKSFSFDYSTGGSMHQSKSTYHILGKWADWKLSGSGDSRHLKMRCTIESGNFWVDDLVNDGHHLQGVSVDIELVLSKMWPNENDVKDSTGTGGRQLNIETPNTVGTETEPSIKLLNISGGSVPEMENEQTDELFRGILDKWCKKEDTLAQFRHVFVKFLLNVAAAKGDYKWVKPKYGEYAVATPINDGGDLSKSVFGALCLTEREVPDASCSSQVDTSILLGLKGGATSALAISPKLVVRKILLPGILGIFPDVVADDFDIERETGTTLINNKEIVWSRFHLDENDDGPLKPTIPKGMLRVTLLTNKINIRVTDMRASILAKTITSKAPVDLKISFEQEFGVDIKKTESGSGWVLVPAGLLPAPDSLKDNDARLKAIKDSLDLVSLNISYQKSSEFQWKEFGDSVLIGFAGALIGGGLGLAVSKLANSKYLGRFFARNPESDTVALQVTRDLRYSIDEGEDTVVTYRRYSNDEHDDVSEVMFDMRDLRRIYKPGAWIRHNKWKFFSGMAVAGFAVGAGTGVGVIEGYLNELKEKKFTDAYSISNFARNCVGATTFPQAGDWELCSAEVRGPLIFGGKFTDAKPDSGKYDLEVVDGNAGGDENLTGGSAFRPLRVKVVKG